MQRRSQLSLFPERLRLTKWQGNWVHWWACKDGGDGKNIIWGMINWKVMLYNVQFILKLVCPWILLLSYLPCVKVRRICSVTSFLLHFPLNSDRNSRALPWLRLSDGRDNRLPAGPHRPGDRCPDLQRLQQATQRISCQYSPSLLHK